MAKLIVGDRVKILPVMQTPFVGAEGIVDEVQPHESGVSSLDRYVVLFKWGEKQTFYDVQLVRVETSAPVR